VGIDVDVRVHESRQQRQAAQVVGGRAGTAAAEAGDAAVANDDRRVSDRAAAAIERRRAADGDRIVLCAGQRGDPEEHDGEHRGRSRPVVRRVRVQP
jgi:hypothetical protein